MVDGEMMSDASPRELRLPAKLTCILILFKSRGRVSRMARWLRVAHLRAESHGAPADTRSKRGH
jgi:hypothetical protein